MLIIIVLGIVSFKKMSVDLFPNVNIPVIFVMTSYEGAGPAEIESLITKPLEEEISTISGIKRLNSRSLKDSSQVIVTFYQNVDIKYAEQQLRDRINRAKYKLPEDVKDPVIRKVDPADQPIITIALDANLGQGELYDLANDFVKSRIEQANDVGLVEIIGGRKREIHILLDIEKMKQKQLSLSEIERQLRMSGKKVGIGTRDNGNQELFFTSDNELSDIEQIKNLVVSFYGNEKTTRIKDIGEVVDTLEDEKSRAFFNGKKSLFIDIYRQSDSNLVAVSDAVNVELKKISSQINQMNGDPKITIFKDASKYIRDNISDVYESITISLILTIIVVFLFLANVRSTFITAISLPIALISAFILMYVANFSLNVISLLALSLSVGLLVDDAIVVTENIYRKIEEGMTPKQASIEATNEILLAVMAITLVVISVFTPVAFMKGTVGEFMKQFGLTMSFAMIVSFVVAITIIPVLCAYLSGTKAVEQNKYSIIEKILQSFNNFQNKLEGYYEKILTFSINRPIVIISIIVAIFVASIFALKFVPKNFLPENDNGEIVVSLELEADANINYTNRIANEIDEVVRSNQEVLLTAYSVGFYGSSQSNRSNFYVKLKPSKERNIKTSDFKNRLREQLKIFKIANPKKLRSDSRLKEVDTSNKSTRLEFKVNLKEDKAKLYGTNSQLIGEELRGYIEGYKTTKFKQNDKEYDVRLRLQNNQNDLLKNFNQIYVSNINQKLIKLSDISTINQSRAPADINRQDRGRYIQISASLAPKVGLGNIIDEVTNELTDGKLKLPPEVRFTFVGESEDMKDLQESTGIVMGLGILFIYLILSSLYESFITPFTILLSLPLALCGAFIALFITQQSFNIFTILGIFLLIGVSSKNSILLIDFANQAIEQGKSRTEAILIAGKTRLRPILMTSFALIAGTIPIAIGLSEASKPRIAMGIAIIGGMISSTIFSLVLVPAIFSYVDRFRVWIKEKLSQFVG